MFRDPIAHARHVEAGLHPLPCPADREDAPDLSEYTGMYGWAAAHPAALAAATPDHSNAAFDGDRPASESCEEEICPQGCECPCCGENRIDWLPWIGPDYEEVECATCETIYTPGDASRVPQEIVAAAIEFERMGEYYAARDDARPKGA